MLNYASLAAVIISILFATPVGQTSPANTNQTGRLSVKPGTTASSRNQRLAARPEPDREAYGFRHPIYQGEPLYIEHPVWDGTPPKIVLINTAGKQSGKPECVMGTMIRGRHKHPPSKH